MIFIIILVIAILIFWSITLIDENIYVFFYEHKDYKWFKLFNKCNDYEYVIESDIFYQFKSKTYPDFTFYIDKSKYTSFVYDEKANKCLVSSFYKKGSKKLANKLLKLI